MNYNKFIIYNKKIKNNRKEYFSYLNFLNQIRIILNFRIK
jgi:hypothetical protein